MTVNSSTTSSDFDKWMASFGNEGPHNNDLEELARKLCLEARSSRQTVGLFGSLDQASFVPRSDTVSWKGVSVKWFLQVFMESPEAKTFVEYGCPMWFIRNHCIPHMIPTFQNGASCCLVDCVEALESPEPLVREATIFVSYTGNYKLELFSQLAEGLEGYYMWSDVFCVDQIAWKRQDSDFKDNFMYRLKENIEKIGFTVLFLNRWDHVMGALSMIWVLWEIFATVDSAGSLEVLLLDAEHERFLYSFDDSSGIRAVFNSLSGIDARKAKGRYEEDTTRILRIMDAVKGVSRVNSQVIKRMREWLIETGAQVFGEALNVTSDKEDGEGAELDAAKLTHNMARLYQDMGDLTEAERLQRKAVMKFRECLGDENLETLTAMNTLAGILRMQRKDMKEAESLSRKVFEQKSSRLGETNHDTLISANSLANLLMDQRKFDEAKEMYQSALQVLPPFEEKEGMELFVLRKSLMVNLGVAFSETGEFSKASENFDKVVALSRSILGNRHPETVRALRNLADLKNRMGDYEAAERLLRDCLQVQKEIFGDSNLQTLHTTNNLATVLFETNRLEEAESLFRTAVEGRRAALGNENQDTLKSIASLAATLGDQGKMLEAEPLFREALRGRRRVLQDDHPDTLASTFELALFLIKTGKVEEAAIFCKKAYDGYRDLYGSSNDLTKKAKYLLSFTPAAKGRCYSTQRLLLVAGLIGIICLCWMTVRNKSSLRMS